MTFALIKTKTQSKIDSTINNVPKRLKYIRLIRKYHKYFSLVLSIFIIFFAISGIILNHRITFSGIDINRTFLPAEYRYDNWNNGAVKGITTIGNDSLLIWGNIGIWLTNNEMNKFSNYYVGFPKGQDNSKIFSLIKSTKGNMYAASQSGIYGFNSSANEWQKLKGENNTGRTVKLLEYDNKIYAMTRSEILQFSDNINAEIGNSTFLNKPEDYTHNASLFKTLWIIHSGKILGTGGKLFVDLIAIIFIFLTITGLIYLFAPKLLKRIKGKLNFKRKVKSFNKSAVRLHNHIGIWSAVFLAITAITGMFLRPPLLIPIAKLEVPIIKGTYLDNPNVWNDKLRDFVYDEGLDEFIISTSEGFYSISTDFSGSPKRFEASPPVSVMGINVFEEKEAGVYMVGSFSGLYLWVPAMNFIQDFITKQDNYRSALVAKPFGNTAVSGYYSNNIDNEILFEYGKGALGLVQTAQFPEMPPEIIESSPMPLWNLALEVHTGRIYNLIFGKLGFFFIPLAGLSILFVIISGVILWILKR